MYTLPFTLDISKRRHFQCFKKFLSIKMCGIWNISRNAFDMTLSKSTQCNNLLYLLIKYLIILTLIFIV